LYIETGDILIRVKLGSYKTMSYAKRRAELTPMRSNFRLRIIYTGMQFDGCILSLSSESVLAFHIMKCEKWRAGDTVY